MAYHAVFWAGEDNPNILLHTGFAFASTPNTGEQHVGNGKKDADVLLQPPFHYTRMDSQNGKALHSVFLRLYFRSHRTKAREGNPNATPTYICTAAHQHAPTRNGIFPNMTLNPPTCDLQPERILRQEKNADREAHVCIHHTTTEQRATKIEKLCTVFSHPFICDHLPHTHVTAT